MSSFPFLLSVVSSTPMRSFRSSWGSDKLIPGKFKQIIPATRTLPNKRRDEQNNGSSRALIRVAQFLLPSYVKQHRPRLVFHVFVLRTELKNINSTVFSSDNQTHQKKRDNFAIFQKRVNLLSPA